MANNLDIWVILIFFVLCFLFKKGKNVVQEKKMDLCNFPGSQYLVCFVIFLNLSFSFYYTL